MSIALWVRSGRPDEKPTNPASTTAEKKLRRQDMTIVKEGSSTAVIPAAQLAVTERHLFLPMTLLTTIHFLGLLPLYIFNNLPAPLLSTAFIGFTIATLPLPYLMAARLSQLLRSPTPQELTLLQCFALMLSGLFLSALATLNFSLSLIVGLLSAPFSFVRPLSKGKRIALPLNILQVLGLTVLSPPVVITAAATLSGIDGLALREVLSMAMTGWWIHGLWTSLVIWLVWWPSWFAASFLVGCGIFS
jgi:glycosylphosphatidylinositol transamidase